MSTSKNRLIEFLSYLKMGQNAFEKKVGISNGYISRSKGSFGSKIVTNISKAYPELNTLWLLTGEGEMLKPKTEPYQSTDGSITLSADVWKLINIQAESIKIKDQQTAETIDVIKRQAESLKIKDQQTSEVIELLKDQLKKGESVGNAKSAVG